jgi:flagellar basal body L-ring protein FlgH
MKLFVALIFILFFTTGCSSFGKWYAGLIRGKRPPSTSTTAQPKANDNRKKYSDINNYYDGPKKKYDRMTHKRMQNESDLKSESGSLWVAEGQESFLFSENTVRLLGDPIPIKLEGDPKDQLEEKMNVIGKLLRKLAEKKKAHLAKIEAEKKEQARLKRIAELKKQGRLPSSIVRGVKRKPTKTTTAKNEPPKEDPKLKFNVKTVPSRITERFKDGSYKVEGSQYFLIEGKEYKVIVSGIIRSSDFTDAGISAEKLLDSRFDIVTSRRQQPKYY